MPGHQNRSFFADVLLEPVESFVPDSQSLADESGNSPDQETKHGRTARGLTFFRHGGNGKKERRNGRIVAGSRFGQLRAELPLVELGIKSPLGQELQMR